MGTVGQGVPNSEPSFFLEVGIFRLCNHTRRNRFPRKKLVSRGSHGAFHTTAGLDKIEDRGMGLVPLFFMGRGGLQEVVGLSAAAARSSSSPTAATGL